MSTNKATANVTEQAPQPVPPPQYDQQQYQQYQPVYVDPNRGKAKWLTLEYALSMGAVVMATLLIIPLLQAIFGGWGGLGTILTYKGDSWLLGTFQLTMLTHASGAVVTAVAAVLLAAVAFIGFGRVSKTIPDREDYTKRTAYKVITYSAMAAVLIQILALAAKLIGILVSALLLIGVANAGAVYKSLFLLEFLPYALALGLTVAIGLFISKIVNGTNASKQLAMTILAATGVVLLTVAITVAVVAHGKGGSDTTIYNPAGAGTPDYSKAVEEMLRQ